MTPPSSSSAEIPHSSTSPTSESKQWKGFEFNGTVYPTYNEMVSAKRERNRRFLEQKLSEVASLASTAASKKSDGSQNSRDSTVISAAHSASTGKKRKRGSSTDKKYKRNSSSFSVDLPLRRNPRRYSAMSASYSDNYDEDDGREDQKPHASPAWTLSSSSHAHSLRKRHRRMESDHVNDEENSQLSTDYSTVNANLSAAWVVHAKAIHVPRPGPPPNPPETYSKGLKLKIPGKRSRPRGPAANDLLPKSDVKDFSAALEHVILNGFRVRNRETALKDFYTSGCASVHVGNNDKAASIDFIDREIYAALNSDVVKTRDNRSWGDYKSSDVIKFFNESDDDDLIPKEYQLPHDTCDLDKNDDSGSFAHTEEHSRCQKHPAMISSARIPLARNNIDCYSKPDRYWDQEFGDGCDPIPFMDQCSNYKDEDWEYNDETPINTSLTDGQYTATLLQRCWERAVHAVSSTVTVHLSEKLSDHSSSDELLKINRGDAHLKEQFAHIATASATVNQSKATVTSFLHREALNVVGSVMDLLLSEKKGLFRDMIEDEGCGSHESVQWYDVFQLLQFTLQPKTMNTIDKTPNDTRRHEISRDGKSLTSEILSFVDGIFHETEDLNTISVADVIKSVSKHFEFYSVDKSMKKTIRARLLELLRGDVKAKTTNKVSPSMVEPIPAGVNAYPNISGSSYSTIQINQNRSPIPLNQFTLKAIAMRLIERYSSVSHKFPS
ncbi:hypothetical protein ACHAW6_003072 [Cyclotella cf. meneghiniana]